MVSFSIDCGRWSFLSAWTWWRYFVREMCRMQTQIRWLGWLRIATGAATSYLCAVDGWYWLSCRELYLGICGAAHLSCNRTICCQDVHVRFTIGSSHHNGWGRSSIFWAESHCMWRRNSSAAPTLCSSISSRNWWPHRYKRIKLKYTPNFCIWWKKWVDSHIAIESGSNRCLCELY